MQLTPREKDKLLIAMAAEVARKRLARGVKLNHPEAIALITDFVVEGARDGRSVADMMEAGGQVITRDQCMDGYLPRDGQTRKSAWLRNNKNPIANDIYYHLDLSFTVQASSTRNTGKGCA